MGLQGAGTPGHSGAEGPQTGLRRQQQVSGKEQEGDKEEPQGSEEESHRPSLAPPRPAPGTLTNERLQALARGGVPDATSKQE